MRVVCAFGGNALSPPSATGTAEEMRATLDRTCAELAGLVADGVQLVITHGNGPQIGRILLQQDAAAPEVPPMPMDVCGAESQGQLGYLLAAAMGNALRAVGSATPVLCLVTQVEVDGRDPAFRRPTKPVGPSYDRPTAQRMAHQTGQVFQIMPDRRWRRVVASPLPLRLVEAEPLRETVDRGHVVIAAGGGGVPVVADESTGRLRGVEAVVDKDRTAALLAGLVRADLLLVLTEVAWVEQGFGTPAARPLRRLAVSAARELHAAGEFPEGSMGPKVAACCDFVAGGGARAVITDLGSAREAIFGEAGTQIVAG